MLIVNCNITVKMNCKQIVVIICLHETLFSSVIILHSMYFVVEFLFSFKKFGLNWRENVKILLELSCLLHLRIEPGLPRVGRKRYCFAFESIPIDLKFKI